MDAASPTNHCCIRMKLLVLLILVTSLVFVLGTITAIVISDQLSKFPRTVRTKDPNNFLKFYMGTFKLMFRNRAEANKHFNYYDTQVRAEDCYLDGVLDFGQLQMYFDSYTATHADPVINVFNTVLNEDGTSMTAEFHVETNTWFELKNSFYMRIDAINDETLGWGVQQLNMSFDC